MSGALLRLCTYDERRFVLEENHLASILGLQSLVSLMETREWMARQEASVSSVVLSQDPLLLLHEGLVGGGLAHVSLTLLFLLEGLHPLLLGGLGGILVIV